MMKTVYRIVGGPCFGAALPTSSIMVQRVDQDSRRGGQTEFSMLLFSQRCFFFCSFFHFLFLPVDQENTTGTCMIQPCGSSGPSPSVQRLGKSPSSSMSPFFCLTYFFSVSLDSSHDPTNPPALKGERKGIQMRKRSGGSGRRESHPGSKRFLSCSSMISFQEFRDCDDMDVSFARVPGCFLFAPVVDDSRLPSLQASGISQILIIYPYQRNNNTGLVETGQNYTFLTTRGALLPAKPTFYTYVARARGIPPC